MRTIEDICEQTIKIVKDAGAFIENQTGKVTESDIEIKDKNSLVSYVDKETEKILVQRLATLIPGAVFFTEEGTIKKEKGEWQWIIDPLDGTTNFLHSIPIHSISVALRHREETVLGIVYHTSQDELFYAMKNKGAFLNESPIEVSQKKTSEALLATGFPYQDFSHLDEYVNVLKKLMRRTRGLRRMGSAAIDLAYVAAGRFDVFFEYGLNAWDIAAGALIVKEAGGYVSNFDDGEDYLFTRQIVAGNPIVHKDVISLIGEYLGLKTWTYN